MFGFKLGSSQEEFARQVRCKKNHPLEKIRIPEEYLCDVCGKKIAKNTEMNECRLCTWDACKSCVKVILKAPQASPNGVNCANQHALLRYHISSDSLSCDGCAATQVQGSQMFGCRVCNFDLCRACHSQRLRSLLGDQKPELLLEKLQGGVGDHENIPFADFAAQSVPNLSGPSLSGPLKKEFLRDELFSHVWFLSKLNQTGGVSQETLQVLRDNEIDIMLVRKLNAKGLHELGIDSQAEVSHILQTANTLERQLLS